MVLKFHRELTPGMCQEFYDHMKHVAVFVHVRGNQNGIASGFFVRSNYILTAGHVAKAVKEGYLISVYPWMENISNYARDGQPLTTSIFNVHPSKDMALLKVDAPENHEFAMIDTQPLRTYEEVYSINNAQSLSFTWFMGNYQKTIHVQNTSKIVIKNMACANMHGGSGGPIFNARGGIVGMLVGGSPRYVTAISSEEIENYLRQTLR